MDTDLKKGDLVEVSYRGEVVVGKVVRVKKKDGLVTVDLTGKHSNEDVGWIDILPGGCRLVPGKAS